MAPHVVPREVEMNVQKISAFTLKVGSMQASVRFYRDLPGMKLVYGGEDGCFSSLCTSDSNGPILNLEQGNPVAHWGRLSFYVSDVDAFCAYLKEKELRPGAPQDASWGERILSHVRPGWTCAFVCASALAVFQ
jgi:catechol 2,3-dioxygenase-like lactoylglutathione lyase family enzyme